MPVYNWLGNDIVRFNKILAMTNPHLQRAEFCFALTKKWSISVSSDSARSLLSAYIQEGSALVQDLTQILVTIFGDKEVYESFPELAFIPVEIDTTLLPPPQSTVFNVLPRITLDSRIFEFVADPGISLQSTLAIVSIPQDEASRSTFAVKCGSSIGEAANNSYNAGCLLMPFYRWVQQGATLRDLTNLMVELKKEDIFFGFFPRLGQLYRGSSQTSSSTSMLIDNPGATTSSTISFFTQKPPLAPAQDPKAIQNDSSVSSPTSAPRAPAFAPIAPPNSPPEPTPTSVLLTRAQTSTVVSSNIHSGGKLNLDMKVKDWIGGNSEKANSVLRLLVNQIDVMQFGVAIGLSISEAAAFDINKHLLLPQFGIWIEDESHSLMDLAIILYHKVKKGAPASLLLKGNEIDRKNIEAAITKFVEFKKSNSIALSRSTLVQDWLDGDIQPMFDIVKMNVNNTDFANFATRLGVDLGQAASIPNNMGLLPAFSLWIDGGGTLGTLCDIMVNGVKKSAPFFSRFKELKSIREPDRADEPTNGFRR